MSNFEKDYNFYGGYRGDQLDIPQRPEFNLPNDRFTLIRDESSQHDIPNTTMGWRLSSVLGEFSEGIDHAVVAGNFLRLREKFNAPGFLVPNLMNLMSEGRLSFSGGCGDNVNFKNAVAKAAIRGNPYNMGIGLFGFRNTIESQDTVEDLAKTDFCPLIMVTEQSSGNKSTRFYSVEPNLWGSFEVESCYPNPDPDRGNIIALGHIPDNLIDVVRYAHNSRFTTLNSSNLSRPLWLAYKTLVFHMTASVPLSRFGLALTKPKEFWGPARSRTLHRAYCPKAYL